MRAMILAAALALAGCASPRDLWHPEPTGEAACGVITIHHADGSRSRVGRPCR
jgi:hypothetical protein